MEINVELFTGMDKFLPDWAEKGKPFSLTLPDQSTISDLKNKLGISGDLTCGILVNGQRIPDNKPLKENDNVSIFPFLAGG